MDRSWQVTPGVLLRRSNVEDHRVVAAQATQELVGVDGVGVLGAEIGAAGELGVWSTFAVDNGIPYRGSVI